MHHDADDQRGPNQHNSQHWETGDGGQFPHVRRVLRFTCWLHKKNSKASCDWQKVGRLHFRCQVGSLTCVAGGGLGILLAWCTWHAGIHIRVPELQFAALTCTRKNVRAHISTYGSLISSVSHKEIVSQSWAPEGLKTFFYLLNIEVL